MRILLAINKLSGGGAERVAADLASALARRHEVLLVLTDAAEDDPRYPVDPRVTVHALGVGGSTNPIAHVAKIVRGWHGLLREKRLFRPQVSISSLRFPNLINPLARTGDKTIATLQNFESLNNAGSRLMTTITRLGCVWSDLTVAVSKGAAADAVQSLRLAPAKTTFVYNPCDLGRIEGSVSEPLPPELEEAFSGSGPVFVNVGRLSPQKGHWHLLRAFREVLRTLPNARLVILGTGYEDWMDALARELGIRDHVFLPGFVGNPYPAVARADVFVLSSMYEGFSMVIPEAGVCGTAVVSTDCSAGPREILAPDTPFDSKASGIELAEYGILVPVCSGTRDLGHKPAEAEEQLLAQAMIRMAQDDELRRRYVQAMRRRVEDFSFEKTIEAWEGVFSRLVPAKREDQAKGEYDA